MSPKPFKPSGSPTLHELYTRGVRKSQISTMAYTEAHVVLKAHILWLILLPMPQFQSAPQLNG